MRSNPSLSTSFAMDYRVLALWILVFFTTPSFGQSGKCEDVKSDPPPVTHFQILDGLQSAGRSKKSPQLVNQELVDEIKKRSVDFALYNDLVKEIKKSGGTEVLLAAIDDAIPNERKGRLSEVTRLDKIIRDNYARNITLRLAINAGKEFLEKYSDEPGYCEFAKWLRAQMPRFEAHIKKIEWVGY